MKDILVRFFRSPLGIAVAGCNVLLAIALSVLGALPPLFAALAALALLALETLLLIQTPLGGKTLVAERDRENLERETRALATMAEARNRLSRLRPAEAELATLVSRLSLAAGRYLEFTARGSVRDPAAEEAFLGSLPLVNDYLRLKDDFLSAQQVGSGGGDAGSGAELEKRLCISLERAAATLEETIKTWSGIEAIGDRQEAREELE